MDNSTHFPLDSVKGVAESIGIASLPDDVAKELSEDVTFRLKTILQDAMKIMRHSKRMKFCSSDFDHTLQVKNIEPLHGAFSKDHIPFRFASGGGRELHFIEDKEMEVKDLVTLGIPRFPVNLAIKPHWLAIEGVQPSIPENPPAVCKDQQKMEAVDPAIKLSTQIEARDKRHIHGRGMKSTETVKVKQLATHELSAEQQLYYKEITEACVGSDEAKRGEALHSLAYDPGLYQMVPRLCTFIAEGVRVNVVQKNLALLIYLMRMARALLDNQTLYLEKYLHDISPSVVTCIVSKQLCLKPDQDNHWALRDFATRLVSSICRNYNTATNGLQTRITRVFSRCLNTEKNPLSTVYGAIAGLTELGPEVSKVFVLPQLKHLSDKIEQCMEGSGLHEKNAAAHIKTILLKSITPVLKTMRNPPDILADYSNEYGYLGPQLHAAVCKARMVPTTTASPVTTPTLKGITQQTRIIQHAANVQVPAGTQRALLMNKPNVSVGQQPMGQKVIIMTSRPPTPNQNSNTGIASSVTGAAITMSQPGGQKFVVVSGPNQPQIKQEIKEEPMEILSPPQTFDVI